MMPYVYPALRYRVDEPTKFRIVASETEDRELGEGWDDPAGVRKADSAPPAKEPVTELVIAPPIVERKKPGRKPKVQA